MRPGEPYGRAECVEEGDVEEGSRRLRLSRAVGGVGSLDKVPITCSFTLTNGEARLGGSNAACVHSAYDGVGTAIEAVKRRQHRSDFAPV